MDITRAIPKDAVEIGALLVEAWRYAYKDIMPSSVLEELSAESRSKGWKQHLESGTEAYVLRNNTKLLGVVSVGGFRGTIKRFSLFSEITALYVSPGEIGMGYGSGLLSHAHERISEKNTQGTVLWVLEKNLHAIDFYKKHGYLYSGESKVHNTGLVEHLYENKV